MFVEARCDDRSAVATFGTKSQTEVPPHFVDRCSKRRAVPLLLSFALIVLYVLVYFIVYAVHWVAR